MFVRITDKSSTKLEQALGYRLNPKHRVQLDEDVTVQFLLWVPKRLYLCDLETSSGKLTEVLKFVVDEDRDCIKWSWKSTTQKQVYYSQGVRPYKPVQVTLAEELVYLPTNEIVKSTDMCDGQHAICVDRVGNRWIMSCSLLVEHKSSMRQIPEPSPVNKFKVGELYASSGHVFMVLEHAYGFIAVKDLCGKRVQLSKWTEFNEEIAEFPDGTRVFARSLVKGFTPCS